MKSKKVNLYLDIDGVLNKASQWKKMYQLNDENIEMFGKLICKMSKKYEVSIILTSTWKKGFVRTKSDSNTPQIKELENKLEKYGIYITAKTPSYNGKNREVEILSYQKYYDSEYAIVIDDTPEEFSKDYRRTGLYENILIYYTDCENGLIYNDVKNIIKYMT